MELLSLPLWQHHCCTSLRFITDAPLITIQTLKVRQSQNLTFKYLHSVISYNTTSLSQKQEKIYLMCYQLNEYNESSIFETLAKKFRIAKLVHNQNFHKETNPVA